MAEILGGAFLLVGTLFMLLAAVGTIRLPDLFMRMHAVTKGGTVGVGFTMLAVIVLHPGIGVTLRALGVLVFVALTAPVSAHVLGHAAYRMGVGLWKGTFVDELRTYYDQKPSEPGRAASPPTGLGDGTAD